jgi:hypothetical protein
MALYFVHQNVAGLCVNISNFTITLEQRPQEEIKHDDHVN